MIKNWKNNKYIPTLVLGTFIIVFIAFTQYFLSETRPKEEFMSLEEHWTIVKDGNVYEDVRIRDYVSGTYQYGEEVEYRTILPYNEIQNPSLLIYSTHTAFEVSIDGEVIYQNGMDIMAKNAMVGYGKNYITLPKDYYGKEMVISCTTLLNDTYKIFNYVEICNGLRVFRDDCIDKALILLIDAFLVIFGCGILMVSIVFARKIPRFFRLACIGAFSVGIGLWSLCNHNMITIFTYNLRAKILLEYVTFYWAPIPFILYFWEDVQQEKRKKFRGPFYLVLNLQVIYTLSMYVGQIFRIFNMVEYLYLQHALFILIVLFVVSMSVYDLLHKNYEHVPLLTGIILLLATGIFDVVIYNVKKYVPFFRNLSITSAFCIGTLMFVIGQIFDFCSEMGKGLYERARTATLEKLVYTDALTGIANRRKCEEDMETLGSNGQAFGILSFDLNDLKKVNDEIGHEKGDELIKNFASILQRTFSDLATVGRMGGDEFIAIFPNLEGVNIDDLLKIMVYYIMQKNEELEGYQIRVAYGYCQSTENPDMDVKDVFKLADARMYKMKYKMKGAYR